MNSTSHKDVLIYGWHPVNEALDEGKIIQSIFIQSGSFTDEGHALWARLKETAIPVKRVPKMKLDRMANRGNHQGVIAFVSPVEFVDPLEVVQSAYEQGKVPVIALLDGVTDVRNLGAIARSAACFGVDGLVFPIKHSGSINAEAVKSSAGGIFKIALSRVKDVLFTVQQLQQMGLQVLCLSEKAEKVFTKCDLSRPTLLVFGAEGQGIRQELLDLADDQGKIAMQDSLQSLNVSVSAGIVFHEVHRVLQGAQ